MKHAPVTALFAGALLAMPAFAEDKREANPHEHGHGTLNMAIEGKTVAIELETPSFDIVGFGHVAESDADRETVRKAAEILADPVTLFGLPGAAECTVSEADVEFGADAASHEDHAEEQAHRDEDKHIGEENAGHSEVHARYTLTCNATDKLRSVNASAYFEAFSNAEELDTAILTDTGQTSGELERGSPDLSF